MKLRIRENTLRFRLTQGEVTRLAGGERIEQSTAFSPSSRLICSIECSAVISKMTAAYAKNRIEIIVPTAQVREWASSEEIAIEAEQAVGGGEVLHILVEKDFQCLHSSEAGEADAFPNPRAG